LSALYFEVVCCSQMKWLTRTGNSFTFYMHISGVCEVQSQFYFKHMYIGAKFCWKHTGIMNVAIFWDIAPCSADSWCCIPEDGNIRNYHCENLKSNWHDVHMGLIGSHLSRNHLSWTLKVHQSHTKEVNPFLFFLCCVCLYVCLWWWWGRRLSEKNHSHENPVYIDHPSY
jgi:hypothetical protein